MSAPQYPPTRYPARQHPPAPHPFEDRPVRAAPGGPAPGGYAHPPPGRPQPSHRGYPNPAFDQPQPTPGGHPYYRGAGRTEPPPPGGFAAAPSGRIPPPPPPATAPRNGFGITALVLAIIGLVFGLVPLTGFIALILGVLAVLFGLLGLGRVRRAQATNKVLTIAGTALGVIATILGVVGLVIVFRAADQLVTDLEGIGAAAPPAVSAPDLAAPALPADATVAAPGAYTWEDGLTVEVGAPEAASFSSSACCSESGQGVAFTLRVVNGTDEVLDPYTLLMSLTSDGTPALEVFDAENGLNGLPTSSIPPGRDLTFPVAFDATGGQLLLEISGFDHESAFFTATR